LFLTKAGEVNLPITLDATQVVYTGPCAEINTTAEHYTIQDAVRNTILKSVRYNENFQP
jgi:hypothetical protein